MSGGGASIGVSSCCHRQHQSNVRSGLGESAPLELSAPAVPQARTGACGALVDRGVGLADTDSDSAERVLTAASELCPASADPWLERAGLRFRASAWREAAELAERAAERDPHNDDAWALVATARYLGDDEGGALDAWNHIGEPTIDTVNISGARQTPQPALHRLLGLEPRTLLTRSTFERAARRLDDAPTASVTSVHFVPAADGRTIVQGAIVERQPYPRHLVSLAVIAGRAILADEVRVDLAGLAGQGEAVTALWRYPGARPRVGASLALPAPAPLPGIATIDAFWEAQTYAVPVAGAVAIERDSRRRVAFNLDTWASGRTRLEGGVAMDRFADDAYFAANRRDRVPPGDRSADRARAGGKVDARSGAGVLDARSLGRVAVDIRSIAAVRLRNRRRLRGERGRATRAVDGRRHGSGAPDAAARASPARFGRGQWPDVRPADHVWQRRVSASAASDRHRLDFRGGVR